MIIATTTDHCSGQDSESASRVTRTVLESFMHRPSLEDHAIYMIATMANNDVGIMRANMSESFLCDAAFVFIDGNRARFLISGASAAYHFYEGKYQNRSDASAAPLIGSGMRYDPRLEEIFTLKKGKHAFLTLSSGFSEQVTVNEMEEALQFSGTPEEWMENLKSLSGPGNKFCGVTAFLPERKPSIFKLSSLIHKRK